MQDPEQYPSVLLDEGKAYQFTEILGDDGQEATVWMRKDQEQLNFTCALSDGTECRFTFEDVFSDQYKQLSYRLKTDMQETDMQYEVVLGDIDQNGILDFLIAFAWRKRIDTPNPQHRYYLTNYSGIWVVYLDETGRFACSEPIDFYGCTPTLQDGGLLYDYNRVNWYIFNTEKKTWLLY